MKVCNFYRSLITHFKLYREGKRQQKLNCNLGGDQGVL